MRTALVSALALVAAQPASASPIQPTVKWIVDFGDSRCVAQRIYGNNRDPVYLLLKASAIGEGIQLSVAVKGPNGMGFQEKAKLYLGGDEPLELSQLRFGAEKKQVRIVNLTKEQTARVAGSTVLRWFTSNLDYSMPLGPMNNLIKVMEECRADLRSYWNGTEEKSASLQEEPKLNTTIRKLFKTDDYPSQAVIGGQSGIAKIVALVDEKGHMADCTIVETSGFAALDAQTCLIVRQRGKFTAAIGADGQPVKGVFTQRIRWEID